ncbi:MAG: DUF72 domain-containing protein [Nannocystis sp.]|nr:DUF72 domain-containing protein [Nannocystis sp.]MBA3545464.1 DUF72 domain-containing protein [Nannocystis sp.]
MPGQDQLDLFGGAPTPVAAPARGPVTAAPQPPELARLAAQLPDELRLGTSSWAFPGWADIVYDRAYPQQRLSRAGLRAYAAHPLLRAVGIDRSYYAPLAAAEFAAYAAEVPAEFRFLVKAHEACTIAVYPRHAHYGALRGQPNPRFLDPAYATEQVIGPTIEGLGDRLGPLLFQFSPSDVEALGGPRWFAERLHGFLSALPRGPLYAVELRNRELLTGAYRDALASTGVCHCINVYPGMPNPMQQFERAHHDQAPALVSRWMLHPRMTWEQAEQGYAPFDRIIDADEERRADLVRLCLRGEQLGLPMHFIVNNNAEGSSPLTIVELARRIVTARAGDALPAGSPTS